MNPSYLFVLGNAPELAEEELSFVLPSREVTLNTLKLLGGTVKIAEIFPGSIVDKLAEDKKPGERIVFGLSGNATIQDCKEIKVELESKGFRVRFVLPKIGDNELSSVVVTKQQISEVYIIDTGVEKVKALTFWVQDFGDWGKRDYGRPQAQGHIGMLPPKVARMMVNIGLPATDNQLPATILDPFCGVGTILAEGLMVGASVVGADVDGKQVIRSEENLNWLAKEYEISHTKYNVLRSDARSVSVKLPVYSVDAIVTEPDLGPNLPSMSQQIRAQHETRLRQLYLNCLEDWKKVLKIGGKVVIAMPFLIDKGKIMGYSVQAGPLPYFRPQAVVKRYIYVLHLDHGTH